MGEQDRRDKNAEELTFTKRHFALNKSSSLFGIITLKNVQKHEYFHFVPTQVFKTFLMTSNDSVKILMVIF